MASSDVVSWQSLYYALIPIALNSMLQTREPTGKICGFDASLRIYLRSSPIVCVMDASFIIIRFAFYTCRCAYGHSLRQILPRVAKKILTTRSIINERPELEEPRPGRLMFQDFNSYLLYFGVALGVATQLTKLTFYSGGSGAILWTQVWAWFYFGSWIVVEVTFWLAKFEDGTNLRNAKIKTLEHWIKHCEKVFGGLAILVQLIILAAVDLKPIPFDPNISLRWLFRGVRFASHCAVSLVHLPFLKISTKIDAEGAVPRDYMGVLLIFILIPHIISALTQDNRYSSLYFMVSIMISYFSWMLYFFSWTKKWILFCESRDRVEIGARSEVGPGHGIQIRVEPQDRGGLGNTGVQNVLAFDFFLRIVFFSVLWYVIHYDSTGTAKPQWTNYLG